MASRWFHRTRARINTMEDTIATSTTYSPTSFIYGVTAKQFIPLECFDFTVVRESQLIVFYCLFQWLSTLFTALGDVPVDNCLLRPHDAPGHSTFGKQRGGVEVLMATPEPGIQSAVVDLYDFLPKTTNAVVNNFRLSVTRTLSLAILEYPLPYSVHLLDCHVLPSVLLGGRVPDRVEGQGCDHIHLQNKTKTSVKTKRWRFENYTKVLKKAGRSNFEWLDQPKLVTLNYAFCGEEKPAPATPCLADLYAPRHCPKPLGECPLSHFTLHQVLEPSQMIFCASDGQAKMNE
ncbi:hypothetical protein PHPALM_31648 [Phytophthora palmivora]|uniref:Uncharacterized protein n=1 Tax=Phytophthora palmivora TaxID=4796 RepID=A0A2P4X216_9STRA|nr:hypothetical protein PHPALM_31648 [Phytophthora palmivora]